MPKEAFWELLKKTAPFLISSLLGGILVVTALYYLNPSDKKPPSQSAALLPSSPNPQPNGQTNSGGQNLPGVPPAGNLNPDVFRVPATIYPRGINFIFFADGYLSWQEFDTDVQLLLRRARLVEPWKSYERYNIYQVRPKELDICSVKIKDERKPVLRCAAEGINKYLNQLRTDRFKLVVLSRREFQSWANVTRLQDSGIFFSLPQTPTDSAGEETQGWLFSHMLGHAFGLKDEEYFVIAKADSAPHQPDGPNCAPDIATAKLWWGDLVKKSGGALVFDSTENEVGFYFGCAANKNYVKPTKSSLMNLNDLAAFVPEYGPVSERYLRKLLDYCFSDKVYSEKDDSDFFKLYPEFKECLQ